MINAARTAMEFAGMLPEYMTPEHTEGREGFIHLHEMKGDCESAVLEYIIRDHDHSLLKEKKELMRKAADYINEKYGEGTADCQFRDSYRNMKEVLDQYPDVVKIAEKAINELGYAVKNEPVRGGTDGANLSFNGLPCPNLGAGGGNFHGRYEYCVLDELEEARTLILNIIRLVSEEA
jgi:tripeptide aminopeptidase